MSITYCERVFAALATQHAMRMRRIAVACPALPYLSTLSRINEKLLKLKCVFWISLQLLSEKVLVLRTIPPEDIINVER